MERPFSSVPGRAARSLRDGDVVSKNTNELGGLRCLLLVMCTHPFAKEALTLHLARSEGHERYFGCNLMHRNVLASSGVVAPLWLRAKSAYGGGRGMFEHEVSQALPVQAREAEEVPRSQLGGITTKGCAAGAI